MTNQNNQDKTNLSHQFDHDVISVHSETSSTGNSPLDQTRTRTHFQLTGLMSQYISESQEHEEFEDQAWEAYKVMSDFMQYLAFQDHVPSSETS